MEQETEHMGRYIFVKVCWWRAQEQVGSTSRAFHVTKLLMFSAIK